SRSGIRFAPSAPREPGDAALAAVRGAEHILNAARSPEEVAIAQVKHQQAIEYANAVAQQTQANAYVARAAGQGATPYVDPAIKESMKTAIRISNPHLRDDEVESLATVTLGTDG